MALLIQYGTGCQIWEDDGSLKVAVRTTGKDSMKNISKFGGRIFKMCQQKLNLKKMKNIIPELDGRTELKIYLLKNLAKSVSLLHHSACSK